MKLINSIMVAAMMLVSAASYAGPITFMSGMDDTCKNCDLSSRNAGTYVNPNGTALDGASWIQSDDSWGVIGTYRVWELDLNKNGLANTISSLFVAFDDTLIIKSRGLVLFDSADYDINRPWNKITDVIALTGELDVAGNGRLNFYVNNTGGPTGLIWKGTANEVPEPGTIVLLGLGLFGLGMARKAQSVA